LRYLLTGVPAVDQACGSACLRISYIRDSYRLFQTKLLDTSKVCSAFGSWRPSEGKPFAAPTLQFGNYAAFSALPPCFAKEGNPLLVGVCYTCAIMQARNFQEFSKTAIPNSWDTNLKSLVVVPVWRLFFSELNLQPTLSRGSLKLTRSLDIVELSTVNDSQT
jgi:hypothetical protein